MFPLDSIKWGTENFISRMMERQLMSMSLSYSSIDIVSRGPGVNIPAHGTRTSMRLKRATVFSTDSQQTFSSVMSPTNDKTCIGNDSFYFIRKKKNEGKLRFGKTYCCLRLNIGLRCWRELPHYDRKRPSCNPIWRSVRLSQLRFLSWHLKIKLTRLL